MTDILVTSMTPALGSGVALRTYGVSAALARLGPLEIRYIAFGGSEPAPEYGRLPGVTLTSLHASRGLARGLTFMRARARGVPSGLARGVSVELAGSVSDVPSESRIIADGPVPAAALMSLARRRPIVYLAHNLESSGFRGPDRRGRLRRFERQTLETFSESWMATRADELGARALAPRAQTRYVPNVVDVDAIDPAPPGSTPRLLLVADFSYAPNREAVAFLADGVMPAVWARNPEVRLRLAGRGLADPPGDPRIEVVGFMDQLRDAYADVAVVLVPLHRGGGSPLKFVEGLAFGLPVVATGHAASLLEDGTPGEDFVVAGTSAQAFAQAVLERLHDPRGSAEIGAAGRALARRCYSLQTLVTLLGRGRASDMLAT
ncbi:MAG: glycosyltransferase family 4 protein [Solirubrobacteraceae bacterium]